MANYKEIVTKAVVSKGKKCFTTTRQVDINQVGFTEMLKIYRKVWLFYNFIRILEIYALFLQTDSGRKARLSPFQWGFSCV